MTIHATTGMIRQIHDSFDRGQTTPSRVTQDYLARIRASSHNAYLTVCEERALSQAAQADQVLARLGRVSRKESPLFGIPMGIKDALTLQGVRTTCASRILENYISPYTATSVARLEAAGAITLGKLNMDEFAMGGSNENSAFGRVLHPTHLDRVPGGSSGGSATAVGADLCVFSLGSDTGGSIRLPASYCGVVGVKPTYGRVSRYGLVAFASSLDQVGPMARSVEDVATVLDVMSGLDPKDSTTCALPATQTLSRLDFCKTLAGVRIGIPKEFFVEGVDAEVSQAVRKALDFYQSQGAKLIPISLPHTQYAISVYYLVAVSEASSNLARFDGVRFGHRADEAMDLLSFYKKTRSAFGPEVKRRIILGTFALSAGYSDQYYQRACQVRTKIKQDFERVFAQVDLIAGPVSPTTAYRFGECSSDPLQMYLNDIFTISANLAGIPAMSLPCGMDGQGLPVGLQLMAPQFAEERLLSVAHQFETRSKQGGVQNASAI